MKQADIVVIGSLNMDVVLRVPRVPGEGETLHASGLFTNPGGKGANQAVACARMGARVHVVGCVGDDAHGGELRRTLEADGVGVSHVRTQPGPSGTAFVFVEADGHNRIVIVAGANAAVSAADIDAASTALLFASKPLVLLQLEVPMSTVAHAAVVAHAQGCAVVLNPSPAPSPEAPLPEAIWKSIDIVVLNEVEARQLTGVEVVDADSAEQAARALLTRGVRLVVVTLGADGLVALGAASPGAVVERHRVPARKVQAVVDTTAAGDTFTGALCASLAEGRSLRQSLQRGVDAAAIAVTRSGAMASMPRADEVDASRVSVTLLPVGPEDAIVLADLRVAAMRPSLEAIGRFDPDRARARLLDTFAPEFTRHIVVAGERVGFVVVRPDGPALLLDHLYVVPSAQGQGAGSAVLRSIIADARAAGKVLRVSALKQSRSNDFYVRHGFARVHEGEWDNHYVLALA